MTLEADVLVRNILGQLDLGNSVAEYDQALERYFVETSTFKALIQGDADIIAGDKGTGKTALFKILSKRYRSISELDNVEVIPAFNPSGNPVFSRLGEGEVLTEGQYITIWKAYVLALVGNWVLQIYEDALTDSMFELDDLLKRTGLRSVDDSANTIFSQIVNLFRRLMNPRSVDVAITIDPNGLPIIAPRVEFGDEEAAPDSVEREQIPHEEALGLLNKVLAEIGYSVWLVLDRLDEAFQGFPKSEVPALRALLRSYLDLNEFPQLRLKLFVRKDLFRRIIGEGFVNLTHVNARKIEIVWDEDDLRDLLIRRAKGNSQFLEDLKLTPSSTVETVFDAMFPPQVDPGERKPSTWVWMMGRIRDGNDVRPPRNLIDLVQKAQEEQIRREQRELAEYDGRPIMGSDALKKGARSAQQGARRGHTPGRGGRICGMDRALQRWQG